MTFGFAELKSWRSEVLGTGIAATSQGVILLAEAGEQVALAGRVADLWRGPASEQAHLRGAALTTRAGQLARRVTALDAALQTAAVALQALTDLLRQIAAVADANGLLITDTGLVVELGAGPPTSARTEVEAAVARATALAAQLDDDLERALIAALRTSSDVRDDRTGGGLERGYAAGLLRPAANPPPSSNPTSAEVIAWWLALPAEMQDDAISTWPDQLGPVDGLPAWVRDRANRIRLARAETDLADETRRLQPPPLDQADLLGGWPGVMTIGTTAGPSRRAAYRQVLAKLEAVQTTKRVLDQQDGHPRQLLVFDVSGRSARVAVAVGDVDSAAHLAVVVDGFTTTVQGGLAGADRAATDLADLSRREAGLWGGGGDVAVVAWLGYDAPQLGDTLASRHSVILRASAEAGASALAPFLRGLPPDRHVTVVGHSYGSTTAGLAVSRGGTRVGDLVAIGSPGLGVGTSAQLGLRPSRVHVLEAPDDPVAGLGWFGADPDHLLGVDLLATSEEALPDGAQARASSGHSDYLTPGTTSQWNVAAVVAGAPTLPRDRAPASW